MTGYTRIAVIETPCVSKLTSTTGGDTGFYEIRQQRTVGTNLFDTAEDMLSGVPAKGSGNWAPFQTLLV